VKRGKGSSEHKGQTSMQAEEVRIDARNGSGHWVYIKTSTVYDCFSLTLRFSWRFTRIGCKVCE
jgi:hypothetical protein